MYDIPSQPGQNPEMLKEDILDILKEDITGRDKKYKAE